MTDGSDGWPRGFLCASRKIPWSEGTATRGTSRRGCARSGSLTTGGIECKNTGTQELFSIERVSPKNKRGTQRKVGPTMFGTRAEWRRNADSMLFLEGELALAVEGDVPWRIKMESRGQCDLGSVESFVKGSRVRHHGVVRGDRNRSCKTAR